MDNAKMRQKFTNVSQTAGTPHPKWFLAPAAGALRICFTHPGRCDDVPKEYIYERQRSSILVTETFHRGGKLTCDRDASTDIQLKPPL